MMQYNHRIHSLIDQCVKPYAITLQIILNQDKFLFDFVIELNGICCYVRELMTKPKDEDMMPYEKYNRGNIRWYEYLVQPKLHSFQPKSIDFVFC